MRFNTIKGAKAALRLLRSDASKLAKQVTNTPTPAQVDYAFDLAMRIIEVYACIESLLASRKTHNVRQRRQ